MVKVSKHKEAAVAKETNKMVEAPVAKVDKAVPLKESGPLKDKEVPVKATGIFKVKGTGMPQAKALKAMSQIPIRNGSNSHRELPVNKLQGLLLNLLRGL